MYVGDDDAHTLGSFCRVVAVLAAVCCCHGDGQQQCVVAMEEMPCRFGQNVLWPDVLYCGIALRSDNTTLWPQCIVAPMYCVFWRKLCADNTTQRFGPNVLHPMCFAGPLITQRFGHSELCPTCADNTTLWPQCIGPITQNIARIAGFGHIVLGP